jgi:hypothetical protein
VVVVRTRQERRELDGLDVPLEVLEPGRELPRELRVGLALEELVGGLEVAQRALEPFVAVDLLLEAGEPLRQLLASCGVVPELGVRCLALEVGELRALAVDVKGTPSPTGSGNAWRGDGRCGRSRGHPSGGSWREPFVTNVTERTCSAPPPRVGGPT